MCPLQSRGQLSTVPGAVRLGFQAFAPVRRRTVRAGRCAAHTGTAGGAELNRTCANRGSLLESTLEGGLKRLAQWGGALADIWMRVGAEGCKQRLPAFRWAISSLLGTNHRGIGMREGASLWE